MGARRKHTNCTFSLGRIPRILANATQEHLNSRAWKHSRRADLAQLVFCDMAHMWNWTQRASCFDSAPVAQTSIHKVIPALGLSYDDTREAPRLAPASRLVC